MPFQMRAVFAFGVLAFGVLAAACADSTMNEPTGVAMGSPTTPLSETTPDGGAPLPGTSLTVVADQTGPVWRTDSVGFRLDQITCGTGCLYQYFQTPTPTAGQRAALESLKVVKGTEGCFQDGKFATLSIFGNDGVRRKYSWVDGQTSCGGDASFQLDDAGYQALKAAVPACWAEKDVPNDGCLANLPLNVPRGPFRLTVKANETHEVFLRDCKGATPVLLLKDPTGQTVIATGTPSGDDCSRIEHRFAEAGDYVVGWELTTGWALLGSLRR